MEDGPKSQTGGNLRRLVSELSLEERHDLLEKLKGQANLSADPLYEGREGKEIPEDFQQQYARLPWYYRLYYFILSVFKSQPPVKIFEDIQVGKLGHEIEILAPGVYNCQQNFLLGDFCWYTIELKNAARFFYEALDVSVNRDRGSFYAFLGSLEMGDIHRRLQDETDPEQIARTMPGASETEIRQRIFKTMEEAFSEVTQEQRNAMYRNTRSLHCLKELSAFLFDRVIMAFGLAGQGQTCPANVVKDPLLNLNNILFSLREPPPVPLLESLFVFLASEKSGEKNFDMSLEMRGMVNNVENAMAAIRDFNRHIPLTRILRCVYRNLNLSPKQISGGEDWFVVYREYWKRQIEAKYDEFIRTRKHNALHNSFRYFLKGTNLKILDNVVSDTAPDGLPIPEAFALSFLLTFYSAVFMADINKIIRPILIDGDFYKRENRAEFNESYNNLIKLEDDIRHFEMSISPEGDLGKRYFFAKQEMSSLPIKRRKIQIVLDEASRAAGGIIQRVREAMNSMINLLNGILQKDLGGKYDTLGNLAQLSGKAGVFIDGVADSVQKFQQAIQIIDDIGVVENMR